MGSGPRVPVAAPAAEQPRVGLIASSAGTPGEVGDRWASGGIAYQPEGCVDGDLQDPCSRTAVTPPSNPAERAWEPYTVIASHRCTGIGTPDLDDIALVSRRLLSIQETEVSAELWTGTRAQAAGWPNLFLASTDSDDLTEGEAVGLTHGLACLQQYLADCNGGQRGMIHATRQIITHWSATNLLRREGNIIHDLFDNVIVPGAGYDGSSPEGRAAATNDVWAYATGMVRVWLGPVSTYGGPGDPSGVTRSNNDVFAFAERPALADWDGCCHGAVRLAATVCASGGS